MSTTSSLVRTPSQNTRSSMSQRVVRTANLTPSASPTNSSAAAQKHTESPSTAKTPQSQSTALPRAPFQQQPSPTPSTPGRWEHPRINEIERRRNKTKFDGDDTRKVVQIFGLLLATFIAPAILRSILPRSWSRFVGSYYPTIVFWVIRLLLTALIGIQCLPLFRKDDPCEDIPLTPAQRQLLGLPLMTRPMTPQELGQTVTPPRFTRSNTPRSASSTQVNLSGSPINERNALLDSASESPANGSPFTPQLHSGGERRRLSYSSNRSSPLSISEFDAAGSVNTPTKSARASVGLNSKWLYEKGRASPRLSGSVFS
ncbi:Hypothetical protein R9X50_00672400 [Acrodontium crateriforme]|uniref:Uncharacterized protein n=1 Tax=Acrodontium crateriforme TaxID=150365 RepID=A0AAQ3RBR3_9PEZI|nr:Hypothetical protein R9X50_00672400 [Acrodontium crateriforme]